MVDVKFVVQCLRRRWWLIALCTVLAGAAGGLWATFMSGEEPLPPFTAEATIYMNGYDSDEMMGYNYKVDESYLVSDARRIVVSDSVAGEVRRKYGEDVVISSPFWKNPETEATFYTHFIFVDASAESAEVAVEAANMAANLAVEKMREQISVERADVYEPAVLKTVVGQAADFGANSMNPADLEESVQGEETGSAAKTILVSAFCAFALSFALVIAYYYVNRRFRDPHDVERILGVPLLGVAAKDQIPSDLEGSLVPLVLDEICERNDAGRVLVCGLPANDSVVAVSSFLKEHCSSTLVGELDFASAEQDRKMVEQANSAVVVITQNAASSSQIARAARVLNLLQIPVAGAIFIALKADAEK